MSESKELVLVQLPAPADLEAAFISDEYISNLIADIRQKALSVVGDVSTVKGRGVYISMASNVRRTKTAIDEAGKNLVAEMKKRPALVDASRKKVRDALDELAVEIRRPATEWEAEQERIKEEEAARVKAENDRKQFKSDHEIALLMNDAFDREAKSKEEEAERQRIAHEEEIKRQAAEVAKREAEAKAQAEIDAAARREAEAKAATERAEREKVELQQKAEREAKAAAEKAEQEKQAAIDAERLKAQRAEEERQKEIKRIADEEARRAADKEHRRTINRQAINDLIDSGLSQEMAEKALIAIASGKVSAVSIKY